MRRAIPYESKSITKNIKRGMNKEKFTLSELVGYVSSARGKDLVFLEMTVHYAYLGLCLSFRNCDVVIITTGLTKPLKLSTMIHELIHVYRGDAKTIDDEYNEITRAIILSYMPPHKNVIDDDIPPESREMEDIVNGATSLLLNHIDDDGSVPSDIRNMYGDRI